MPYIVGIGLTALDLIVQNGPSGASYSASGGGTCGNVLAILARMGWRSSWFGALDDSASGHLIRAEMIRAGVFMHSSPPGNTSPVPVFAHHIDVDSHGHAHHWFSDACPHCGGKLPTYERPSDSWLNSLGRYAREADVFFADRLSDGVVDLAKRAKHGGALVVYEPSSSSDAPWMSEMIGLADIVKYSHDRAHALESAIPSSDGALWIETQGRDGLRWAQGRESSWHVVPAVDNPEALDSCGAGDWFTSALLYLLLGADRKPADLGSGQLDEVLRVASKVAAWSCGFLGARGALYDAPIRSVYEQLNISPALSTTPQKLSRPEPFLTSGSICAFT